MKQPECKVNELLQDSSNKKAPMTYPKTDATLVLVDDALARSIEVTFQQNVRENYRSLQVFLKKLNEMQVQYSTFGTK